MQQFKISFHERLHQLQDQLRREQMSGVSEDDLCDLRAEIDQAKIDAAADEEEN